MNEDEFSLPDCGVLSAVTYRKLQESNLNVAYTGIDIAPQIIDDCRRRFRDVDWRVMDVQQLELPTASYDVVVVRHVLEHLPYYDGAIQEARRVCKRFAVFCLFFPLAKEDALAQKTKADGTYHYNTYGREGFLQLLRKEFTTVTEKMVEDPQRDNQLFICQV